MANKRMFSYSVLSSDEFYGLPASTQCLYIHLCMGADDDGFNSKVIYSLQNAHARKKDYNLLVEKGYLIPFENGVVAIRHWHVNNNIRKDRYHRTVYTDLLDKLYLKDNGTYEVKDFFDNQTVTENSTEEVSQSQQSLIYSIQGECRYSCGSGDDVENYVEKCVENSSSENMAIESDCGCLKNNNVTDHITEDMYNNMPLPKYPPRERPNIFNIDMTAKLTAPPESEIDRLKTALRYMGCKVSLSDKQIGVLIEKLGFLKAINYIERLADFISERGAYVKNHYSTIIKWAAQDGYFISQ